MGSDWRDLMNGKMNFASIMMKRISGNDCIGTRRFALLRADGSHGAGNATQRNAHAFPALSCICLRPTLLRVRLFCCVVDRLCADQAATRASRERAGRHRLHVVWVPVAECAY